MEREKALEYYVEELKSEWNSLVDESIKELDGEENWIAYRFALLKFALKRIPPTTSHFCKPFKREVRYYL